MSREDHGRMADPEDECASLNGNHRENHGRMDDGIVQTYQVRAERAETREEYLEGELSKAYERYDNRGKEVSQLLEAAEETREKVRMWRRWVEILDEHAHVSHILYSMDEFLSKK